MKIRIATLFLTILCLALTASAGTTFYNDGAIDGNDNGFFITGPNFPNIAGSLPGHFERVCFGSFRPGHPSSSVSGLPAGPAVEY